MKKLLTLILFISFLGELQASEPKKSARWQQLMKLVDQELKILSKAKRKTPELNYRMLELQSEKLKLLHEKNNKEFLEKSKVANVTQDKESYFKETRNYYKASKEFGLKILKDFPKTKLRAEVLFALALNSRDYGHDSITEKYLLECISLVSDPHHSLRHHAETALADFYYNEKRYQDAVTYYEKVLWKTQDEWLSKHYLNVAWCYLKVKEFDKAVASIKKSYFLSKNKSYVDIRDQVLIHIGSFFVYTDHPLEGLDFYLKNEKDPIAYLMPMAQKTSERGLSKETEAILDASQNLIDKNQLWHHQEELFHQYLDFYRNYNRFSDYEKTSSKLVAYYNKADANKKLNLKTDLREDSIEKIRTTAGFLQIKLAKDMKEAGGSFKDQEMAIVLSFFNQLITLDPKRKAEYLFYRGETNYSIRRFPDAAVAYAEALTEAKLNKNLELSRKILNSLLALTGLEALPKDLNKKYLIFAYTEHITIWPKDPISEQIYPKLFEIYRESGFDNKAAEVLRLFNKSYPDHLKDQQALMTKILDLFIEKKDTRKLAAWVKFFKKGFLSFTKDMIEKIEITLGNMLFLEYQGLAKKGDKVAAAKGFESIYQNDLYSDKVKSQSAFFASMTYLELAETEKSYAWQELAFNKMTDVEKLEKRDEMLKMSERTYRLQDFVTSHKMSEFFLKKFCSLKDDIQNRFFEVAVMTALVEENTAAAENVIVQYSECLKKMEARNTAIEQMYAFYEKKGDFRGLRLHVHRYPIENLKNQYRFTLQKWFWENSSLNLKEMIKLEFKTLKHPETIGWLKEMDDFNLAVKFVNEMKSETIWDKPTFDGDAYNAALEAYLLKIQNFKKTYEHLTSSSQIDLVILATHVFSSLYQTAGKKIGAIHPAGMDDQTFKQFSEAMKPISTQFTNASKQYTTQLDKALKDKETLAWGSRSIASVEHIENPVFSFFTGLTMDKGAGGIND